MAKDFNELYNKLSEEAKARIEAAVQRELAIMDGKQSPHEPPFDGIPCPMCPSAIRNMAAVAHNLEWRIGTTGSFCKINEKWSYLKDAVEEVEAKNLITEASPEPLRDLLTVCKKVAAAKTLFDLESLKLELKMAKDAVQPLSDKHFENQVHSHGTLR